MKKVCDKIVKGLKDYCKKNGFSQGVVGLSGGVDSAVTAAIAVKALGKDNVFGLLLPEKRVSSKIGVGHAVMVAEQLGMKYTVVPINGFMKSYSKLLGWRQNKDALINTKARVRMSILYNYANTHKALVLGTSNKSELILGYFTKYGDGGVDVEVIGSLYKTEVFELARYLGLHEEIVSKVPSAELYIGHTDEAELGGSYEEIDVILQQLGKGKKVSGKLARNIVNRIKNNTHKTKLIPTIK